MLSEVSLNITKRLIYLFCGVLIISVFLALIFQKPQLLIPPLIILGFIITLSDYKILYYLLFLSVPVSLHIFIGSLAIDVLTEPLLIGMLMISPFIFLTRHKEFTFLGHPVILLLLGQFIWAIYTSFFSVDYIVSIKFILAKAWYIVPIVFLGGLFIKEMRDFKIIFWLFFISMILVCLFTIFQHSKLGFNFESANFVMRPFFVNHVLYSATIAIFLPFVWFARYWYNSGSLTRIILNIGIVILIFSVATSYTRASWLAVLALIPCYFIIKWRLTKPGIIILIIGVFIGLLYINHKNKYLDYAIEYTKVIFHKGDIEGHLEATYQMQDVSGIERIYRWVAAKKMIEENWILGSGPNTFFPEYKKYAVGLFSTYVSDNIERSTTHNYFLMIFTEQGLIGFMLFTGMYIFLLIKGTNLSITLTNKHERHLAIACTLSLFMLTMHLFLNDLIETDKIGILFYLNCILIIKLDQWGKEKKFQEISQDK